MKVLQKQLNLWAIIKDQIWMSQNMSAKNIQFYEDDEILNEEEGPDTERR